jgi:hypothetical protein
MMDPWGFGNLHSNGRCVGDSPGSLDFHWLSLHGFAHIIFLLSLDTTCSLLAGVVKKWTFGMWRNHIRRNRRFLILSSLCTCLLLW